MLTKGFEHLTQFIYTATHASRLTYASVAAGCLVAIALFKPLFRDFAGFRESLRYWFRWDIFYIFGGDPIEERWNALKVIIWVGLAFLIGWAAYHQFPRYFPTMQNA